MGEKTFTQEEFDAAVSEYKNKYDALMKRLNEEKEENDYKQRFESITNGRKFVNDLTREGLYGKFKEALNSDDNKGKTDAEVYEALTKDKNYYENPNKPADMLGMGHIDGNVDSIRHAMGLDK